MLLRFPDSAFGALALWTGTLLTACGTPAPEHGPAPVQVPMVGTGGMSDGPAAGGVAAVAGGPSSTVTGAAGGGGTAGNGMSAGGATGVGGSDAAGSGGDEVGGESAGGGASGDAGSGATRHRFNIEFDYRFDTVGFFTDEHKAVMDAAATVWEDLIGDDFATIPAGTPIALRSIVVLDEPDFELVIEKDIDDLLLFVACSPDLDAENVNGRTRRVALFPGDFGAEFQAELTRRWRGPDQEPWAVSIAFGCAPDPGWFIDPTPETSNDLPTDRGDFMATVLHEIGHALGFGASQTFEDLSNAEGTEFLGPRAVEVFGGPVPLDDGHFPTMMLFEGERLLMDPGRAPTERDFPTRLDLAVFEDIGYEILSVP